ncbi:uncharacterized protein LOC101745421 isoform X3 [Bombyx mori]|uniref:Uncharacterized protein n=1 Tax=Bombyx mori TaxID=7091 RepID=A0A8R2DJQ6_BOMMO|nr:uncharacterized protein LOC101745421 isoform X3 [Bombyx mori]
MFENQNVKNYLQSFKYNCSNSYKSFQNQNISSTSQFISKTDLHELLEIFNTSSNLETQIKLISILNRYLLTNNAQHVDVIIRCKPIYYTIDRILGMNLPKKTATILNFLTLILFCDNEECTSRQHTLTLFAKNMIRTSGCLATLIDVFLAHMVSVQKCRQGAFELFPLIQSLTSGHKRNVKIFIECEGISLFSRRSLQMNSCMHLLASVVETCTEAAVFVKSAGILEHVRDLLRLQGPYSQMGQWATIVLYYADLRLKEHLTDKNMNEKIKKQERSESNDSLKNVKKQISYDDTNLLFRSIIKEIAKWQPNDEVARNKSAMWDVKIKALEKNQSCIVPKTVNLPKYSTTQSRTFNKNLKINKNNKHNEYIRHESQQLSFSFLQKRFPRYKFDDTHLYESKNSDHKIVDNVQTTSRNVNEQSRVNYTNIGNIQTDWMESFKSKLKGSELNQKCDLSVIDFKPIFVSTPKHSFSFNETDLRSANHSNYTHSKSTTINKRSFKTKKTASKHQQKISNKKIDRMLKNRSLGSRLFNVINNSCTTLMKTVKNIFGSRNYERNGDESETSDRRVPSCSFSFTNYMRKRDAVLMDVTSTEPRDPYAAGGLNSSCQTCNDTDALQHKILDDKHLQQTVKKLKMGINVYGCDFKKISKSMWPLESYMTPTVLYNLYRKLIMK